METLLPRLLGAIFDLGQSLRARPETAMARKELAAVGQGIPLGRSADRLLIL
jgi:hypothetical protein